MCGWETLAIRLEVDEDVNRAVIVNVATGLARVALAMILIRAIAGLR